MTFTPLQKLLPRAARKHGVYKTIRAIEVCRHADHVLDELFAARKHGEIKPKSYRDGTLKITVANSVLAQEVFLHRKKIIYELHKKLGRKPVRSVKITTRR